MCTCWHLLLPPLKSCPPGVVIGVSEGIPISWGQLSQEDGTFVSDILRRCIPPCLLGGKPHSIGIPASPSYMISLESRSFIITNPSQPFSTVPTWLKTRCGRHYIPVCLHLRMWHVPSLSTTLRQQRSDWVSAVRWTV